MEHGTIEAIPPILHGTYGYGVRHGRGPKVRSLFEVSNDVPTPFEVPLAGVYFEDHAYRDFLCGGRRLPRTSMTRRPPIRGPFARVL